MIDQRPTGAAPAVRAVAEALPLPDDAVDAALAVFAVHHWRDPIAGLAEMRRVARRQVVVTWHPGMFSDRFWFVRDYLPQVAAHEAALATLDTVTRQLQATAIVALPVPADCTDGFFGAYWSRPHAYLDSGVRAAISALAQLYQPARDRESETRSAVLPCRAAVGLGEALEHGRLALGRDADAGVVHREENGDV